MTTEEKDFQTVTNEYAQGAIQNLREMIQAMEHAHECDGECEDCSGTGVAERTDGEEIKCQTCDGTGKCAAGKDSDNPDSWHDEDSARQRIEEDALSVEVRGDWHTPGDEDGAQPTEYAILLTTGGPAARIVGDLDAYKQPRNARFEYQDWFKPWTEAHTDSSDGAVMLEYAQCFYFGE